MLLRWKCAENQPEFERDLSGGNVFSRAGISVKNLSFKISCYFMSPSSYTYSSSADLSSFKQIFYIVLWRHNVVVLLYCVFLFSTVLPRVKTVFCVLSWRCHRRDVVPKNKIIYKCYKKKLLSASLVLVVWKLEDFKRRTGWEINNCTEREVKIKVFVAARLSLGDVSIKSTEVTAVLLLAGQYFPKACL